MPFQAVRSCAQWRLQRGGCVVAAEQAAAAWGGGGTAIFRGRILDLPPSVRHRLHPPPLPVGIRARTQRGREVALFIEGLDGAQRLVAAAADGRRVDTYRARAGDAGSQVGTPTILSVVT